MIYNLTRKTVLCRNVRLAATFFGRLQGLMLKPCLSEDEGLLLFPCQSIHTCFMRFPIDAVFLDAYSRVVGLESNLQPWRISRVHSKARYVLELPAGQAARSLTKVGDVLRDLPHEP